MSVTDDTATSRRAQDAAMVLVAKRRGIIRLTNGSLVTLLSWGTSHGRNRMRVELPNGETRMTLRKSELAEVIEP